MIVPKAAHRYAKALLEVALEQKQLDKIYNDMDLIFNTVQGSKELELFLRSPIVKADKKQNAIDQIFGKKITEIVKQFIQIISRKGREELLYPISAAFIEAYNNHKGIVKVDVTSARELNDKEQQRVIKALESYTGKKVQASMKINESLIGGLKVQIGDTVIDGSVTHKLDNLKDLFYNQAV